MVRLILISGKAESGKTLTANIMKEGIEKSSNARCTIVSFASYLKFICKQYYGWDGLKDEHGRGLLQYVGTDLIRKKVPNYWVKTVADFVLAFDGEFDYFIADDTRFINEIRYFHEIGINPFTIRVERLNYKNSLTPEQRLHPSETNLDNFIHTKYIFSETGVQKLRDEITNDIFSSATWYFHDYDGKE